MRTINRCAITGFAALAFALLWVSAAHFTNPVLPFDDGFILYRYVDNLFAGHGPVYNPGARVFGVSTPLYLGWLALLKALFRQTATPDLAVRANLLFLLATGLGLFALLRRLFLPPGLAAALAGLFLLRPGTLTASLGGMESLAFTGLVVWALWALAARRFRLAALLAGLSVPVRLEGVLLCAVVGFGWLATDRRHPVPVLAALAGPALGWTLFGWTYYGSPVYHSLAAKLAPLYPLPAGNALVRIGREAAGWTALGLCRPPALLSLAPIGLAAAGLFLRRRLFRLRAGRWAAPALAGLLLLFYLGSNPLMFEWYFPVLEMLWLVLIATGLCWGASKLARGRRWPRRLGVGLSLALAGLPALLLPARAVQAGSSPLDSGVGRDPVRTRVLGYRQAAEWLNTVVPDGVTLAGPEIGALGYYYRGPVLDACGLVSPEALPFLPVPADQRYGSNVGAIGLELVRHCRPDIVVSIATFADKSLYASAWFHAQYLKVRQFPLPLRVWGAETVQVHFRRDRVAPRLDPGH